MDYFKSLIGQSISRSREATLSMLGINNAGLRAHVGNQMTDELGAQGCFLAPPVFEHTFGWDKADLTMDDIERNQEQGLLSPAVLDTLDKKRLLKSDSNGPIKHRNRFGREFNPYKHQLKAWETLLSGNETKSVVVTSGTGSGKTECFMLPVLHDIYENSKNSEGVNAIFLYPLNALIASQQKRMHAWCKALGGVNYASIQKKYDNYAKKYILKKD